jgi:hypothetical protein
MDATKRILDMLIDRQLMRGRLIAEGVAPDSIQIKLLDGQIERLKESYRLTQTTNLRRANG